MGWGSALNCSTTVVVNQPIIQQVVSGWDRVGSLQLQGGVPLGLGQRACSRRLASACRPSAHHNARSPSPSCFSPCLELLFLLVLLCRRSGRRAISTTQVKVAELLVAATSSHLHVSALAGWWPLFQCCVPRVQGACQALASWRCPCRVLFVCSSRRALRRRVMGFDCKQLCWRRHRACRAAFWL